MLAVKEQSKSADHPVIKDSYDYDFLVFVGRFQPFHKGHEHVIKVALKKARHVVVLIGSAKCARSLRNPFSWQERSQMIRESFTSEDQSRLHMTPLLDLPYAEGSWVNNVKMSTLGIVCQYQVARTHRIGLIGHSKDQSSYYLDMFPEWESENVSKTVEIDATDVRDPYLAKGQINHLELLPDSTIGFLGKFKDSDAYQNLQEEYRAIAVYKEAWTAAPYAPTFMTVDSLLVHKGVVLLIQRKNAPGKGLWALPGGFLDGHETMQAAAIRELKEETNILAPESVLIKAIKANKMFDDPHRSSRGRTITNVYHIDISGHMEQRPLVNAADDAASVMWVPADEINPEVMFEDHYSIIRTMLG